MESLYTYRKKTTTEYALCKMFSVPVCPAFSVALWLKTGGMRSLAHAGSVWWDFHNKSDKLVGIITLSLNSQALCKMTSSPGSEEIHSWLNLWCFSKVLMSRLYGVYRTGESSHCPPTSIYSKKISIAVFFNELSRLVSSIFSLLFNFKILISSKFMYKAL